MSLLVNAQKDPVDKEKVIAIEIAIAWMV